MNHSYEMSFVIPFPFQWPTSVEGETDNSSRKKEKARREKWLQFWLDAFLEFSLDQK